MDLPRVSTRRESLSSSGAASAVRRLSPVRKVSDERGYLYQLIETIGSGPDLETILQGIVVLVTEATACHACLIWFEQEDRLVLRSASAPYAHLAGSVSMALDEGLAGWVFRTRRSAFIRENALQDPRVKYFPELEEEEFQSLVSVPIPARAGNVIGVIALHAEAPHEFGRADLDFLEHTASLIAGAVENARLYEVATARVEVLSALSRLSQRIATATHQDDLLRSVVEGTREVLRARRVEVKLSAPDARGRPEPDEPDGVTLVARLVAGDEDLGHISAVLDTPSAEAETTLAGIAAHAAVALKQHQVIERLLEKNLLKDFFRALSQGDLAAELVGELAARLACDLDAPHVVVHIVPGDGPGLGPRSGRAEVGHRVPWSALASAMEDQLAARFPGALVDVPNRSLRALVPVHDGRVDALAAAVRGMGWEGREGGPSVGLSDVCLGAHSFARAFEEAEAAAEVGVLLRGGPGITTFEDLGPYRYVLGSENDARDRTQQRLEMLVDYDARRGTTLLDTLEGYLDHRGNVVKSSRLLFIHPNTLRQRMDRIRSLTGFDLDRDDWLSLAIATKVVKLRRMRRHRGEGGNDG